MNASNFLQSAIQQFRDYKAYADKTFAQLEEKDFYFQPNEVTNSVAVNITHLHGNMQSRWTNFLTEDGEKEWRQRDEEFETRGHTREELMQLWEQGWKTLFDSVSALSEQDLDRTIHIRAQPLTVIEAIHRQLTHHASHVGQIVLLGKIIRGKDWKTLSIPKGQSKQFNEKLMKK